LGFILGPAEQFTTRRQSKVTLPAIKTLGSDLEIV
jgi:hypothetical protein